MKAKISATAKYLPKKTLTNKGFYKDCETTRILQTLSDTKNNSERVAKKNQAGLPG